jgi:transcriptional regulator with XRE-family HTH domain
VKYFSFTQPEIEMIALYQDPTQFIAARRQELGLTAAELGARIGYETLAASTISMIESGRAHAPLRRCREFAAALQVDEAWLTLCMLRKQFPEAADVIEKSVAAHCSNFQGEGSLK